MAICPVKSENRRPTYRTLGVMKLCYEDGCGLQNGMYRTKLYRYPVCRCVKIIFRGLCSDVTADWSAMSG